MLRLARNGVRMALGNKRAFSAAAGSLQSRLAELVPQRREELAEVTSKYGDSSVGEVSVNQLIGGARGVKCMLWETSVLDPEEGIRFRGKTIPEVQAALPKPGPDREPYVEGMLWFLLTGEVPSEEQTKALGEELHARSRLPHYVESMIRTNRSFTNGEMHPMTQFSSAVLGLQTESRFAHSYTMGAHKNEYWVSLLEDVLDLIARLPEVVSLIYRINYKDGRMQPARTDLDYGASFAHMLGFDNEAFDDLMRLYLIIHTDHEGGNVSAHTTRLVGSALSDPYLSFAAALNGLAGPLHGLANQEVLRWIMELEAEFKSKNMPVNEETIREYAWSTLKAGRVIPGYGHAVLRRPDPRYMCQREFALKHMPDDPLFKIVSTIFDVVPDVLMEHGKTKNPWPNVDSHSGVLLHHYGLDQVSFYTVLFGMSRAIGVLSQLFWDRALGLPLERPKSVSMDWIKKNLTPSA